MKEILGIFFEGQEYFLRILGQGLVELFWQYLSRRWSWEKVIWHRIFVQEIAGIKCGAKET